MKISVITVAYNAASTIGETLDSIAKQTHIDVEHLIIDGGSVDQTVEVIKKCSNEHACVVSEKDEGIYDAMNKGLRLATGEVIGFLNADDIFADDAALARVAEVFNDPLVEACFGDLLYVTANNRAVVRYWKSRPYTHGSFARGWAPAHPTFYIRRSALERLGFFDLSYRLAADTEFMLRYLEKGGIRSAYIPEVLVRMRIGGATNNSLCNIFRQNIEIFRALKQNAVAFSPIIFIINKVYDRLWQRYVGAPRKVLL